MEYFFCQGCDQRKAEVLFVGVHCTRCIKARDDAPVKKEREFTDEEYEKMGEM